MQNCTIPRSSPGMAVPIVIMIYLLGNHLAISNVCNQSVAKYESNVDRDASFSSNNDGHIAPCSDTHCLKVLLLQHT